MFNSNKSLTGRSVSWARSLSDAQSLWALSLSGHSVSLGTQTPWALSLPGTQSPRHSVFRALSLSGTQSLGIQSLGTRSPCIQSLGHSVSQHSVATPKIIFKVWTFVHFECMY